MAFARKDYDCQTANILHCKNQNWNDLAQSYSLLPCIENQGRPDVWKKRMMTKRSLFEEEALNYCPIFTCFCLINGICNDDVSTFLLAKYEPNCR